jgi:hypothetical protein
MESVRIVLMAVSSIVCCAGETGVKGETRGTGKTVAALMQNPFWSAFAQGLLDYKSGQQDGEKRLLECNAGAIRKQLKIETSVRTEESKS